MNLPSPATRSILLGVLAVTLMIAAYFAFVPLFAEDSESASVVATAPPTDPDTGTGTSPEVGEPSDPELEGISDEADLGLTVHEIVLTRDPFEPVRDLAANTDATVETVTTPGADDLGETEESAPSSVDDDPPPETAPTATTDPPSDQTGTTVPDGVVEAGCTDADGVVCEGAAISLVEIDDSGTTPSAVVQVDSRIYDVEEGELFAGRLELVSIDGSCADFRFGADRFQLCEGARALK